MFKMKRKKSAWQPVVDILTNSNGSQWLDDGSQKISDAASRLVETLEDRYDMDHNEAVDSARDLMNEIFDNTIDRLNEYDFRKKKKNRVGNFFKKFMTYVTVATLIITAIRKLKSS